MKIVCNFAVAKAAEVRSRAGGFSTRLLSSTEHLTTDQKVTGLNPVGVTLVPEAAKFPASLFSYRNIRDKSQRKISEILQKSLRYINFARA